MGQKLDATPKKKVVVSTPHLMKSVFGPQGQRLIPTITQELCGTTGLSACMVYMPPGRIAKAHLHERTDVVVVVIEGYAATLIGPEQKPVFHGPGEFIFIPEGVIHTAVNLSTSHRLIAIEMRTDPKLNEDVVAIPEYDNKAAKVVNELQTKFAKGELALPVHWDIKNFEPFKFADVAEAEIA